MLTFEPCLKTFLSHIARTRLTVVPAANSKRFTHALDMKSAPYAGGKMMVKMTMMQIKSAADPMAH
jgi:hypothetical protein